MAAQSRLSISAFSMANWCSSLSWSDRLLQSSCAQLTSSSEICSNCWAVSRADFACSGLVELQKHEKKSHLKPNPVMLVHCRTTTWHIYPTTESSVIFFRETASFLRASTWLDRRAGSPERADMSKLSAGPLIPMVTSSTPFKRTLAYKHASKGKGVKLFGQKVLIPCFKNFERKRNNSDKH